MSVRKHTSTCQKNTKEYAISLYYGAIAYSDMIDLSQRQFNEKYPNIEKSLRSNIFKQLRKLGYGVHDYDLYLARSKKAVLAFFLEKGQIPTSRDTYHIKDLPSDNWCKKYFGSWNNFILECGLEPSEQSGYGIFTKAEDGITYRSNLEATFVNKYLHNKYTYEYEKPYPTGNRISDFYIVELDLYIEVAGGLRPEVISEKIQYSKDNNINLKVVYPRQILSNKIILQ